MTAIGRSKYRGTKEFLLVYHQAISAARYCGQITYSQVARILGISSRGQNMGRQIGQVLGEISEDEDRGGRPMLSAVVVGVSGMPGEGFFVMARRLGKFSGNSPTEQRRFWETECERVYETWRPNAGA